MLRKQKSNVQYSEVEAARKLGLTVEQLRTLVKSHIVREADGPVDMSFFNPSDLVLLRILSGMQHSAVG